MKSEQEVLIAKAESRININIALLSISFLLFTLIATINPEILSKNIILTLELTLTIPFLVTSCLARTKNMYSEKQDIWNNLGFITYILGYSLLINVIGIFLCSNVNIMVGMIFFTVNILMALVYSFSEIKENTDKLKSKFYKDSFFILLLILGGILPSLRVY